MKKLNLLHIAFLAAPFFVTAQINQTPIHTGGGQIDTRREASQPATGSMFINDAYLPAKVSNSDKTLLLRYNAYSDYFEINNPQAGEVTTLPKETDVNITFNNNLTTYSLVNYKTEKGDVINGYLIVINESPKVKIYKRERIFLQPESFPSSSYTQYKPASYKKAGDEYYIKIKDNETIAFSTSRNKFSKLFKSQSKEVSDYIKKNSISLDKENDLKRLASYLETIL